MAEGNGKAPDQEASGAGEDYSLPFTPAYELTEVETKTGEEDEEIVFKTRAKLFRFSKELNEWKERGTGDVRVLQHKQSRKIRLLMRRDKTLKICLNHYVNKKVELRENMGSDRSWVWYAADYADGERDECTLAIRFTNTENAKKFKGAYDASREYMKKLDQGINLGKLVIEETSENTKKEDDLSSASAKEEKKDAPKSSLGAALQESIKISEAATQATTSQADASTNGGAKSASAADSPPMPAA